MYSERGPNDIIIYVGSGQILKRTITDGDRVTLRSGDQDVLVRDVVVVSPGRFSGRIYGFEPSRATELNGLQLEEHVEFEERHVFGCIGA